MNVTDHLVIREDHTLVVMCTTSLSRPAASVLWYKDEVNFTSDATTAIETQKGDKYTSRSYFTLTGNKFDNSKMLKCEGYNGINEKVTNITALEIWCK